MARTLMILSLAAMTLGLTACKPEGRPTPPEAAALTKSVHTAYARKLPGCPVTLGIENYWKERLQRPGGAAALEESLEQIAASKPSCLTGAKLELASSSRPEVAAPAVASRTDVELLSEPCPGRLAGVTSEGYVCFKEEAPAVARAPAAEPVLVEEPASVGGVQ